MDKKTKKTIFICLASLALAVVSCIALFFAWQAGRYMEFDSDKWKNEQLVNGKEHIRKKMIRNLLESERLIGKTSTEIDDLLGSPSGRGVDSSCDQTYYIGPETFGVDSVFLCINFSQRDDRVVAARTATD